VTVRGQAAVTAGALALLGEHALRRAVAADGRWMRTNYRGRRVSLTGGPAVAVAALVGAALTPQGTGAVVAGGTAAALGLYDDLYGDSHARGLRGHLRALQHGRVTTGMVKLVGLGAGGLLAARMEGRRMPAAVADAALVAGAANLLNLFDLRPGRALKLAGAVATLSLPIAGAPGAVAAATAATAVATLPSDLDELVMIGDCGANALGALLGWTLATGLTRRGRAVALGVVVGLTLVSERTSFTSLIDATPWLRAVDAWGRR
jgi:UDP-GlcNAc:undecaprenyl-phosphate/decaprenyl-phosphate GlcNAc-1-phosphate transferase